jgi:hypothetical protein
MRLLMCCLALITAVGPAGAQVQAARRELVGFVRDPGGTALEGATVVVRGTTARTDARGSFQIWTPDVDTLTIAIRRLGYVAVEALLTAHGRAWDTVVVELDRNTNILDPVIVSESVKRRALGLRDFDERRRQGLGQYVTRDEIAARNNGRLSDVFRSKRGVRLVALDRNYGTRLGVRFALYAGSRASCIPDIWLDGQRVRGMEIDDLTTDDVEAIELYETFAATPSEFSRAAAAQSCGTIVIWSRVPPPPKP